MFPYSTKHNVNNDGSMISTLYTCMVLLLKIYPTTNCKMIETEKQQVKDFRSQGYSDRQLQEIGFCEAAIRRAPSVAMTK